jgi:hypothetical protein
MSGGKFAIMSLGSALALAACSEATQGEEATFEIQGDNVVSRGISSESNLTATEWDAYRSARQYLRNIAPAGTSVQINHADPKQHEFALLRFKLAGKTKENSPDLYKAMEQLVSEHRAQGVPVGTFVKEPIAAAGPANMHTASLGMKTQDRQGITSVQGSRKDALSRGYVDATTWDSSGAQLGPTTFYEVFGNMPYGAPQGLGAIPQQTTTVEGDSVLSETLATGTTRQFYVATAPQVVATASAFNQATVMHPRDTDANGFAVVCLDRSWTGDCEYNNTGMLTLKVPLLGGVSLADPTLIIDEAKVIANRTAASAPGTIYAVLGTSGGGCKLPVGGAGINMKSFWQQVSFTRNATNEPISINWDMFSNPTTWADFSANCRLVQDTVYVTMEIPVPFISKTTGAKGTKTITVSNAKYERPLAPPDLNFSPPVRVTNSCLAEGTVISSAGDVAGRKIEDIKIGDVVGSPYAEQLTVTDVAAGTERAPIVVVADNQGHELMLTEMHPLFVIGKGMVPAKQLAVGDRVNTTSGPSELVRVERKAYGGKVYNLKVGNQEEAKSLGVDQTAVYANGFLVGDGQVQSRHETLAQQAAGAPAKRLPMRMRTDYQTSMKQAVHR